MANDNERGTRIDRDDRGRSDAQQQQGGSPGSSEPQQGGQSDWDEQQGIRGQPGGGRAGGDWDRQQGTSHEQRQQGGGSEFERDQQSHQRRGQDSIESDR